MNKLKMQSKSLVDENIEKISSLFPNCVSEGLDESGKLIKVVDFDLLKQELSDIVVEGNEERYVLNWAGKKASMLAANAPIAKTLRPVLKESVGKDGSSEKFDSENLYIEGDNLDVLKLLRETYLGKVKMIYIDPPYNTGKDFVYKDDFSMTSEEYFEKSNQIDDQGNRLFTNNDSNGRFHSDWLSMMYMRLKLARDLLTEDGVIFISIDDNEQANLKKLCEEIFGYSNTEVAIWNKEADGSSGTLKQTSTIRRIHEYVLCVYKNYNDTQFIKIKEALKGKEGEFQTANLAVNLSNEKTDHKNYFTIKNSNGDKFTRQWKWSKEEIDNLIKENLIYWGSDGRRQPRLIIPTDDRRRTFLLSILNYGGTTVGRKDFEILMGRDIEFSYPKPLILLKKLLETSTNSNSIILDFFSGSATTAHAVMQLNAEDGGNRKHIMVQLPENTDEKSEAFKAGYKTIPDIAKERIRRAGKKILEDNKNSKEPKDLSNLDIGFRVLKLDDSNMKDVYYSPSELKQETIFDIAENIKEDRTEEDLLFQVMLDMGVLLSSEIKTLDFDGKKVFNVNDGNLVCCFDKNLSENIVTQIAQMKPLYAVFRDSSISSDSMSANFDQIFETYSPTTTRKVL